jgi:hypothetical protein
VIILPICAGLLAIVAGVSAGQAGEPGAKRARTLTLPETACGAPEIVTLESDPHRFELVFQCDAPTPGWVFRVDGVEVDEESRRIVANVTQVGPEGIVATVITKCTLTIPLENLAPGPYLLEIRTRRGESGSYGPYHTVMLLAR